jgi:amidohydrolase
MTAPSPADADTARRWVSDNEQRLIAIRRDLHSHPELSGQEFRTTDLIERRLADVGYRIHRLSSGTGLIADIGDSTGLRRAVRADLDALAMDDLKEVDYRSTVDGVAHACGHDLHTTAALGTALYFAERVDQLERPLRFIFQPAEERVPGGALDVLRDDGLVDVESVIGLHCEPKLDCGTVGLLAGPITSAADMATIELTGPGGHTARPELTVDLVTIASRLILELPELVATEVARRCNGAAVKVVFGAVHSGDAANVIPTSCQMRASIRTPSLDAWDQLDQIVSWAADSLVADTGASHAIDYVHGVPPTVNDAQVVERLRTAAASVGGVTIVDAAQSWGGDDFAWMLREVPGAYVRLGVHAPGSPVLDLHAGLFDVDERAIAIGTLLLIEAVLA